MSGSQLFGTNKFPGYQTFSTGGLGTVGSLITAQTSTGTNGPGSLIACLDAGDNNSEIIAVTVSPPSSGSFFLYDNGSFQLTGAASGTYSAVLNLFQDGVSKGNFTDTIIIGGTVLSPSKGSAIYAGYIPQVVQQNLVKPSSGSVKFTGYSPVVGVGMTIIPGKGSAKFTGYQPIVTNSSSTIVLPGTGSVKYAGYAPTVTTTGSISVSPKTGNVKITGYAPAVIISILSIPQFTAKWGREPKPPTNDFPFKGTNEAVWITFDFSSVSPSINQAQITISSKGVTPDPTPENILSGPPIIQGGKVVQFVQGGIDNAVYEILCSAVMYDGQTKLNIPYDLPVYAL